VKTEESVSKSCSSLKKADHMDTYQRFNASVLKVDCE
jgi:hypothetical protein